MDHIFIKANNWYGKVEIPSFNKTESDFETYSQTLLKTKTIMLTNIHINSHKNILITAFEGLCKQFVNISIIRSVVGGFIFYM